MTYCVDISEDRMLRALRRNVSALCRQAGISRATYYLRRRNGLSHEQALSPQRINASNRARAGR